MKKFSTVGIFCKKKDDRIPATLKKLNDFLLEKEYKVVALKNAAKHLGIEPLKKKEFCDVIDIAIVVGGDGTLLNAGRLLADKDVPVIGINLGRLGFLVDVSPDLMEEQLTPMLAGESTIETRSLLFAEAFRGDESLGASMAFNDVVLHARDDVRMIEFDTHIDDVYVNTQRADGMVIATPTGSTAYALSSGGPILHPSLNAVVLVPICPHTLSHRPIVVHSDSVIEILLCESRNVDSRISFDGQSNLDLLAGDRIVIRQHPHKLRLIHPENYDYYQILRTKLGWSTTPP
jgi:NAD+ kinase